MHPSIVELFVLYYKLIVAFCRICINMSLHSLRKEIKKQLDVRLLPESYVFLRSVGRHLTWVSVETEVMLQKSSALMSIIMCRWQPSKSCL